MNTFTRRAVTLFTAFAAALVGVVVMASPAAAAPGNILPPFDIGTTWNVCQGYNGTFTHTETSQYGLDLTGAGCDNSASGRNVRTPIAGTVAYYQASHGNLCVNIVGGSYTLTHVDSPLGSGVAVTAGQLVGTVAAPNTRSNNGVAHIHFQMWTTSNCYSSSGVPFDSAHNNRICGAPDMTASGPNGGNGIWSGTSITGANCDGATGPWQWHLRNLNSDGGASTAFSFGNVSGDHPITGDWDGNGTFTPGVVRAVDGAWQWHLRNDNSDGGAYVSFTFGVTSDNPIVGDWDGNGSMTPGITRAVNGELQWHLKNANDGGGAYTSFNYGASTDSPVVGDWDGSGTFTPGVVRSVNGELQWHLRSENSAGGAYVSFSYGAVSTDHPKVGDWDGDGTSTPGVVRNSQGVWQWHLRNFNSTGVASLSFSYGSAATDMPIVGDWDGSGTVTAGVTRAG